MKVEQVFRGIGRVSAILGAAKARAWCGTMRALSVAMPVSNGGAHLAGRGWLRTNDWCPRPDPPLRFGLAAVVWTTREVPGSGKDLHENG
jgi:hypothetical protein